MYPVWDYKKWFRRKLDYSFGYGAFSGKMLLVRIVEMIKLMIILGQVR